MKKRGFICYRRDDTDFAAYFIKSQLEELFGDVFYIDVQLQAGENWTSALPRQVQESAVVVVVIGPGWLTLHDEHHRRRIDAEDDVLRREIEYAMNSEIPLIPVLIGRATMPSAEALPRTIRALAAQQAVRLMGPTWKQEFWSLANRLQADGFVPIVQRYEFPIFDPARVRAPVPIAERDLPKYIGNRGWQLQRTHRTGTHETEWQELYKSFKFETFDDAMRFMNIMADHCRSVNHHPRWENLFQTLHVWLSTWVVGKRITINDVKLAKAFDEEYDRCHDRDAKPTLVT